jgi:hypothetical protein
MCCFLVMMNEVHTQSSRVNQLDAQMYIRIYTHAQRQPPHEPWLAEIAKWSYTYIHTHIHIYI